MMISIVSFEDPLVTSFSMMLSIVSFEEFASFLDSCTNSSGASAVFDGTKEMRYRIIGYIDTDICNKKNTTIVPLATLLILLHEEYSSCREFIIQSEQY